MIKDATLSIIEQSEGDASMGQGVWIPGDVSDFSQPSLVALPPQPHGPWPKPIVSYHGGGGLLGYFGDSRSSR